MFLRYFRCATRLRPRNPLAPVTRTVIPPQVKCPAYFLASEQRFVKLFSVPRADNPDGVVDLEDMLYGFGQRADGACRSLLNEEFAGPCVLEGVNDQVDRVVQRHHEPR